MIVVVWAFLFTGIFFIFTGIVGVLRLPDFYCRLHAVGKCDTLGVGLMLTGLAIHEGFTLVSLKVIAIIIFIGLANPTATHALARAAMKSGMKPWTRGDDPAC